MTVSGILRSCGKCKRNIKEFQQIATIEKLSEKEVGSNGSMDKFNAIKEALLSVD